MSDMFDGLKAVVQYRAVMPKIADHMDFIRLMQRSPRDSEGFHTVSKTLMSMARKEAAALDKVLMLEEFKDGTGRIRLTPFGADMLSYM